ncbi:ABC transporter ATP-binding protein [Phorcysia thermohydrogeniphila]|uniref:Peptide/nickel transport system ATP-binding protein n=1 Tax=Phorcysia thermohydrogeniphila TaxID=936138 RepID=A0A4R1GCD7_9BACT|nr:ABC transporter ATP-binding protein [Phorcysia thermohydrogeniphila]TCK03329.1 peptide/nickel transport system ATP-binding protein [Phorcysia thermohydrogeniphila]
MPLVVEKLSISTSTYSVVKEAFLRVEKGKRVAVVGESGSGKSLTALSILKLLPESLKVSGKVEVDGTNVLALKGKELRNFRWKKVAMVFQDPSASLNPLMKVKDQIGEAILYHGIAPKEEVEGRVLELLKMVNVPEPEEKMNAYPHHLSGGLKQRVAIAMALACDPDYLIADEPTTALDVTVQARILELLKELSNSKNMGILLITHDMGVVWEFAEEVFVMYAGYTVEAGRTEELFKNPLHPYTKGLIECSPRLKGGKKRKLPYIPGSVPEPSEVQKGCPFYPRCPIAKDICEKEIPPAVKADGRVVRCFLID